MCGEAACSSHPWRTATDLLSDMSENNEKIPEPIVSDDEEAGSVEVTPNITAELNNRGELIGIEILGASTFIRLTPETLS
ncbi:Protein of unknown function DUF2283 [Desulfonatronospira thiodismutans ASO3-1]|uniref:DUF2283 domain-containing protein n=2 Tax=Desulfonatronospira thiodismutans TaxID=488939 RepID=D6SUV5_9BACT|nr:Protein of unknown function DUF2283 [Desulfonatronospira thiodismutans ASO3-1]